MRDTGHDWNEIRSTWKALTGKETAMSSLPVRYRRMKANFEVLKDEDVHIAFKFSSSRILQVLLRALG